MKIKIVVFLFLCVQSILLFAQEGRVKQIFEYTVDFDGKEYLKKSEVYSKDGKIVEKRLYDHSGPLNYLYTYEYEKDRGIEKHFLGGTMLIDRVITSFDEAGNPVQILGYFGNAVDPTERTEYIYEDNMLIDELHFDFENRLKKAYRYDYENGEKYLRVSFEGEENVTVKKEYYFSTSLAMKDDILANTGFFLYDEYDERFDTVAYVYLYSVDGVLVEEHLLTGDEDRATEYEYDEFGNWVRKFETVLFLFDMSSFAGEEIARKIVYH